MTRDSVVSISIADAGVLAYMTAEFLDLATDTPTVVFVPAVPGTLALPDDPLSDYAIAIGGGEFSVARDGDRRVIRFVRGAEGDPDRVVFEIDDDDALDRESVSVAQPFTEAPGLFFYENKRAGMSATATVETPDLSVQLTGDDADGIRDFGRGAWPVAGSWTWATVGGVADGHRIGVNLGTVHSDESRGNPNALTVDGVIHKLAEVDWTYDAGDSSRPWRYVAPDGRVDLTLTPFDTHDGPLALGDDHFDVKKAYGPVSGTIVEDDGTVLHLDGLSGATETADFVW